MDSTAIESRLRDFLTGKAEEEGIAAAYLFGSVARGTARPESDVDVGILYSEDPPHTLEGTRLPARRRTWKSSSALPVQLVVLNRAPVDLIYQGSPGRKAARRPETVRRGVRFEVKIALRVLGSGALLPDVLETRERATMTDLELVAKKLALIETSVQELRTLARPAEIQE